MAVAHGRHNVEPKDVPALVADIAETEPPIVGDFLDDG